MTAPQRLSRNIEILKSAEARLLIPKYRDAALIIKVEAMACIGELNRIIYSKQKQ